MESAPRFAVFSSAALSAAQTACDSRAGAVEQPPVVVRRVIRLLPRLPPPFARDQIPKADAGTRTPDPFITSEVLYQLSYVGGYPGRV
jgi:hypothetical protein